MRRQIPALTVTQWLSTWDDADFSEERQRRQPSESFVVFSINASTLRKLTGIQRRKTQDGQARATDFKIQRSLDPDRSSEIADFVRHGFPWSKLSQRQRESERFRGLTKPGWLPMSIVVNILSADDEREGDRVHSDDLIHVELDRPRAVVDIPDTSSEAWSLSGLAPIEVIDGQHRLWAFDNDVQDFELPVVAFVGLDRSWQAYLFYTINISPKKINSSLAYDLYPLLRTEDWLEKFEGHVVYRETRAQEITEALWSYEKSPWHNRINMLGDRGRGQVSQASWIRNLISTFIKSWEGRGVRIGGLFGAPVGEHELALPWNRAQQAAFLIYAWNKLAAEIRDVVPDWVSELEPDRPLIQTDIGIESPVSMLNSDMGVRGFLHVLNDLCYVQSSELELHEWSMAAGAPATSADAIEDALDQLASLPVGVFVSEMTAHLALYDWRSSRADGLDEPVRRSKARFRGSGGYKELRKDLLEWLAEADETIAAAAADVQERLRLY